MFVTIITIIMLLFTVIAVVKKFFIVHSSSHYVVHPARDIFFFFCYSIKIRVSLGGCVRFLCSSVKIFVLPSIKKAFRASSETFVQSSCKHNIKWSLIDYMPMITNCQGSGISYDFEGHSNYYCLFHIAQKKRKKVSLSYHNIFGSIVIPMVFTSTHVHTEKYIYVHRLSIDLNVKKRRNKLWRNKSGYNY